MATSTCGLILKSQSGLFYELQGADLPQAASGTQVLVTGRWQRGKETATCHSRADVGSIRVDKWHAPARFMRIEVYLSRAPNSAEPTRTCVAPQRIAAS